MEAPAPKTYTLTGESLRGYQNVQVESRRRGGEDAGGALRRSSRAPEVKPFGQHIAHIALSQEALRAAQGRGHTIRKKDEKEETTRSKADNAVALVKGSSAYCEPLVSGPH